MAHSTHMHTAHMTTAVHTCPAAPLEPHLQFCHGRLHQLAEVLDGGAYE